MQVQKIGEPVTVGHTRPAGGLVVGIGAALGQVGVPISFGSMCPPGFGGLGESSRSAAQRRAG